MADCKRTLDTWDSEDGVLTEGVARALCATGHLSLRDIDITVEGETVYLSGRVPSYYLKQVAQMTAAGVSGVRIVRNELGVFSPG